MESAQRGRHPERVRRRPRWTEVFRPKLAFRVIWNAVSSGYGDALGERRKAGCNAE